MFQNGVLPHLILSIGSSSGLVVRVWTTCVFGEAWGEEEREVGRAGRAIGWVTLPQRFMHKQFSPPLSWAQCNSLALLTIYISKSERVSIIIQSLCLSRVLCLLSIPEFTEKRTYKVGYNFFLKIKKNDNLLLLER